MASTTDALENSPSDRTGNYSAPVTQALSISEQMKFSHQKMNRYRQSSHLCDVNLVVQGRVFPAHRAMLAAGGGFFEGIFEANMKENNENEIELTEIDSHIVNDLLSFIYTGEMELSTASVLSIAYAVDFLLLDKLKGPVDAFMAQNASQISTDYLSTYLFAEHHKYVQLQNAAYKLVCENFGIIANSQDFLKLDVETVKQFVASEDLKIADESIVYDAIIAWIRYKEESRQTSFYELLHLVRLCSLSKDFIHSTLLVESLVVNNLQCLKLIMDSQDISFPTVANKQHPRACLDKYTNAILAFPSKKRLGIVNGPWCFVPVENKWYHIVSEPPVAGKSVNHECSIYIVGKEGRAGATTVVAHYDIKLNKWQKCKDLNFQLPQNYCIACLDGLIYIISGQSNSDNPLSMVNSIDIGSFWLTGGYMTCAPLHKKRTNACAISDGQYLYVFGGQGINRASEKSLEKYDPKSNVWANLAPMRSDTYGAQAALAHGKIYVTLGLIANHISDEVYDIATDTWSSITKAPYHVAHGAMIKCDDKLYVIGISDTSFNEVVSLSYDLKLGSWSDVSTSALNHDRRMPKALAGVVVRLPKESIAKLPRLAAV